MRTVGVRELKVRASEILRLVRETGETFDVTVHGRLVARIVPARRSAESADETARVWADLDALAEEIAARWPAGVSAADAVAEDRREL